MDSTKYYADPSLAVRLGSNSYIWFNKIDSSGVLISREQFDLLSRCTVPRHIEEHARVVAAAGTGPVPEHTPLSLLHKTVVIGPHGPVIESSQGADRSAVESQLRNLVKLGLLAPFPENGVGLKKEVRSPISCVGIVTRDRPAALERCIRSYLSVARTFDRSIQLYIIDGSVSHDAHQATMAAISRAIRGQGVETIYLGLKEKIALVDQLASICPRNLLWFALIGFQDIHPQTGANRNCLTLATLDQTILSVDDDTYATPAANTFEPKPGVRLTSASDFEEYDFKEPHVSPSANDACPIDLFSTHEDLTSRSLDHILDRSGGTVSFGDAISGLLTSSFRDSQNFRVGLTISGVAGSSGTYSSAGLFNLRGASLSNLLRSEAEYQRAIDSDQLIRRAVQATVTDNPWCMTTAYSISHRLLCMPFLPFFRNQDGLFGQMCRYCFPKLLFGHARSVVWHENVTRVDRPRPSSGMATPRMAELIEMSMPSPSDRRQCFSPEMSLKSLGSHLESISGLDDCALQDYLLYKTRLRLANTYQFWERQLAMSAGQFPYFERQLSDGLRELHNAVRRPTCWVPADIPQLRADEQIPFVRTILKDFGALLALWPAITERVTALKTKGFQIGTRIF